MTPDFVEPERHATINARNGEYFWLLNGIRHKFLWKTLLRCVGFQNNWDPLGRSRHLKSKRILS